MTQAESRIDPQTQKNIDSWLEGDFDPTTQEAIRTLQRENPAELVNAFYKTLSFGTGGLRGIMGVGTNRINPYTIRAATQGLANHILKQPVTNPSVFIGFDCRHHSHAFAKEAAQVLAANGIEVFLYQELRPLPNICFGLLHKGCIAGIMITASHNPPQYNGYKVYWTYGGQVLPPHDQLIIDEVNRVKQVRSVPFPHPLIHEVGEEIDQAYLKAIHPCQLHPEDNQAHGKALKIVYTSLHGGGIKMIPTALREWGFTALTLVDEQAQPDGDFPTVKSPNPEEPEALALGVARLQAIQGDLLMGTDPDTDRLGVAVMHKGKPFFLDGNQVACLLLEHTCSSLKNARAMPSQPMCIKTIVTTELFRKIAEHYNVGCLDVLTGFKYVGEKIGQWEKEKAHHFLLAAEESYGYLIGTHVRDKDAIVAATCLSEVALQMKLQGKTLVDLLHTIYQTHGIYREKLLSLTFEGREGAERIAHIMANLRSTPPTSIDGIEVTAIEDYLNRTNHYPATRRTEPLLLPTSDVIRLWLADGTKIVVRPSGTEPKIKIYCGLFDTRPPTDTLEQRIAACDARASSLLASLKHSKLFSF